MLRTLLILAFSISVSTVLAEPLASPYDLKVNQTELYARAYEKARAENKMVVVIFGTEWCGYCLSLGAVVENSDTQLSLERNFVVVHIGLEAKDRTKSIGGIEVFEQVNKFARDRIGKIPGYPWPAMVNPKIEKSVWIDSSPFEGASSQDERILHDPKKVVVGLEEISEALKE